MAKPLPPKSDKEFWIFARAYDGLVRDCRVEAGKVWNHELKAAAEWLHQSLFLMVPDIGKVAEELATGVAWWCDRKYRMKRTTVGEIGRKKYLKRVEEFLRPFKVYLAEQVLAESEDDPPAVSTFPRDK